MIKRFNVLKPVWLFLFLGIVSFYPMVGQVTVHDPQLTLSTFADLPVQFERPVCLGKLPNGNIAYSNLEGDIFEIIQVNFQRLADLKYSVRDHNLSYVSHMEIKENMIYLCGSVVQPGDSVMIGYVMQGNMETESWRVLAESEPYYLGRSFNDHRFSSLIVSLDGKHVYVHSGTRTNSGEVHELDGVAGTKDLRWQAIRGKLFKLPTDLEETIYLPNDSTALYNSGYQYAEGLRHLFAMAWGTDGNFYGGSNSDRRDVSEAFYKLEEGGHYGFPWWIGGEQNPLQFPDYNPQNDRRLPSNANNQGYYDNDPNFPQIPEGLEVIQPFKNIGPDGDKFRNAETGVVEDASDQGLSITSFSAHRSPVGLIFDRDLTLPTPFRGEGFMVSYTRGGNILEFRGEDDGQDLLQISILEGDSLSARRLASGFNRPIDVMLDDGSIYLLDMGNSNGSGRKIYRIQVEAPTNILPNDDQDRLIKLFPNPTAGKLYFENYSQANIRSVDMYDQLGKRYNITLENKDYIDLKDFSPQVYFLTFHLNNGTSVVKKVLKDR